MSTFKGNWHDSRSQFARLTSSSNIVTILSNEVSKSPTTTRNLAGRADKEGRRWSNERDFFQSDLATGSIVADNGTLYEVMSFNRGSGKYICRPMTDGVWLGWAKQQYPKLSIPQNFKAYFQAGQWLDD